MTQEKNIDLVKLTEQMELFLRRFADMEKVQSALRAQVERLTSELAVNNEELNHKVLALEAVRDNMNYSFQGIAAGVVAVDRRGNITVVNKVAEDFLGITAGKAVGQPIEQAVGSKGGELASILRKALLEVRDLREVELEIDGTQFSVSVSLIHLVHGEDAVGAVLTFKDISEVNKMQEHLARKSRLAALGEMAAGLAHEIRNPLGGIELYASLLARDLKDRPPQEELVVKVLKGVRLLNKIVEDMLAFTKNVTPVFSSCDVRQALMDAMNYVRPQLEEKNIVITESFGWDQPIIADGELLRRAFMNIVLNAVQMMPSGGKLTISMREETEGRLEIVVQDSGPGIDEKIIDKIFNPFFTHRPKGTGLGLTIVHRIVESHGGEITAANAPEGGAVFTVRLPREQKGDR